MKLTLEERETIIRFDDSDDKATFYTCNQTWIRKLDKMMSETRGLILESKDEYSKTYIFPKKWLRVQKPVVYSEEQRAKMALHGQQMAKNLKKYRENKK